MTTAELKAWLDGYMTGAGDKADPAVIVAKVKEVTDGLAGLKFGVGSPVFGPVYSTAKAHGRTVAIS